MCVGAHGILKALPSSQDNSQKAQLAPAGSARKSLVPHELNECIAMKWLLPTTGTGLITQRNELRADFIFSYILNPAANSCKVLGRLK